jgi:hypothetical protein
VAGVCANVIYQDDPESLEKYAQRVQGNLKLISEHVSNWLNQSLVNNLTILTVYISTFIGSRVA